MCVWFVIFFRYFVSSLFIFFVEYLRFPFVLPFLSRLHCLFTQTLKYPKNTCNNISSLLPTNINTLLMYKKLLENVYNIMYLLFYTNLTHEVLNSDVIGWDWEHFTETVLLLLKKHFSFQLLKVAPINWIQLTSRDETSTFRHKCQWNFVINNLKMII